MKSAKEMFEELDYTYFKRDEHSIFVTKQYYIHQEDGDVYSFNYNETIFFSKNSEFADDGVHLEKEKSPSCVNRFENVEFIIYPRLLKAITKQCEELGWLDEPTN